jgi:CDP-6-deoxy-D-xylo-4-hexulose-3-dehydrase
LLQKIGEFFQLFNTYSTTHLNKDIFILEDNCESMGAEYKGKQAGTFGVMGTFSTFFSHHMATMEGGMADFNAFKS